MKSIKDDRRFYGTPILVPETSVERQLVRVFIRASPCAARMPVRFPELPDDWGVSYISVPDMELWGRDGALECRFIVECNDPEQETDGGCWPIRVRVLEDSFIYPLPLRIRWELTIGEETQLGDGATPPTAPHVSFWAMEGMANHLLQLAAMEENEHGAYPS